MNALTVKKIKKKYKDLTAVDGASLTIHAGSAYGILGPNGAGKSTMINCILGLIPFDSGTVLFEEKYKIKNWNRNIGYVPQELAIYPDLTPVENVSFFASLYGFTGQDLKERTEKALDFVGLVDVKNKKSREFSGGMKRRLNLACAIAHSPKMLIMDEPTVGIDPQSRNRILENVRELNSQGATIIYTTHYMPEVEEICNCIAIMDHGKVIAEGTKHDIMSMMGNDEILNFVFCSETKDSDDFLLSAKKIIGVHSVVKNNRTFQIHYRKGASVIENIMKLAGQYGLTIESIQSEEPTLEDIFLSLTGKSLRDMQ